MDTTNTDALIGCTVHTRKGYGKIVAVYPIAEGGLAITVYVSRRGTYTMPADEATDLVYDCPVSDVLARITAL